MTKQQQQFLSIGIQAHYKVLLYVDLNYLYNDNEIFINSSNKNKPGTEWKPAVQIKRESGSEWGHVSAQIDIRAQSEELKGGST